MRESSHADKKKNWSHMETYCGLPTHIWDFDDDVIGSAWAYPVHGEIRFCIDSAWVLKFTKDNDVAFNPDWPRDDAAREAAKIFVDFARNYIAKGN